MKEQVLEGHVHLRRRGRSAERLRPRGRSPDGGAGHQSVHEATVRGPYELQPDRHGEDHRADPRLAAHEPARSIGNGDASLLPNQARPDAIPLSQQQDCAQRDEPPARPVEGRGAALGQEIAGPEPGQGR